MLHVWYRRCHGFPSKALQLSHFIAIVEILVAVRIGFRLYQFNTGRYNHGQVRGCVIRHRLCFWFEPIWQISGLSWMVYFLYRHWHRLSVTNYQIHSHKPCYTITLLPTCDGICINNILCMWVEGMKTPELGAVLLEFKCNILEQCIYSNTLYCEFIHSSHFAMLLHRVSLGVCWLRSHW
jgi:hypothetical protein